jgi:hypothetical protein
MTYWSPSSWSSCSSLALELLLQNQQARLASIHIGLGSSVVDPHFIQRSLILIWDQNNKEMACPKLLLQRYRQGQLVLKEVKMFSKNNINKTHRTDEVYRKSLLRHIKRCKNKDCHVCQKVKTILKSKYCQVIRAL